MFLQPYTAINASDHTARPMEGKGEMCLLRYAESVVELGKRPERSERGRQKKKKKKEMNEKKSRTRLEEALRAREAATTGRDPGSAAALR